MIDSYYCCDWWTQQSREFNVPNLIKLKNLFFFFLMQIYQESWMSQNEQTNKAVNVG